MFKSEKKVFAFTITAVVLLITELISLCIGKFHLDLGQILCLLFKNQGSEMAKTVFFKLRMPRTIMAVLAGAGLGLGGAVFQIVFKNPLASPDIIGVSSGVNLGAALAIVLSSYSMTAVCFGAFAGGLVAVGFVILLVKSTGSNTTSSYVLSGIIIAAIAKALIIILKYYADSESQLAAIEYWTMGSLASISIEKLLYIIPFWLIGFFMTLLLHRQISLLSLNDDESRALGVRTSIIRTVVLFFCTLLISSIISVTGLIAFAGLIAPHIAKLAIKKRDLSFLVMSSLLGAVIILVSDILARSLGTAEIPLSVLTTIIGVPVLVFFMLKRRGKRL